MGETPGMSISNARMVYGLSAAGTATRPSIAGTSAIGVSQSAINVDASDIAYAFTVTSTGAGDEVTLTLTSGAVTTGVGTPTIDGAGVDFEGNTLETAALIHSVLVTTPTTNTGRVDTISAGMSPYGFIDVAPSGSIAEKYFGTAGLDPTGGTVAITFSASGDSVTIIILASA